MNQKITLREILTPEEIERYWNWQDEMHRRDVFPDTDLGAPVSPEDEAWLLGPDYRVGIEALCRRETDPVRRFFFRDGAREVGFAVLCVFASEDSKCLILNFCVDPALRCRGIGARCFSALAGWAGAHGAAYFELNTHCRRSMRFWQAQGFAYNGFDDHGSILLCRGPESPGEITVERLSDPEDAALGWQLRKLENGFLAEIGEPAMDDAKWDRLARAVRAGQITFFLARRGYRAIGMCSVSPCFSTFACTPAGIFDDFFVEPVFRGRGAARALTAAARAWCRAEGMASLMVGCSAGDADMYRALGFETGLGTMLACTLLE